MASVFLEVGSFRPRKDSRKKASRKWGKSRNSPAPQTQGNLEDRDWQAIAAHVAVGQALAEDLREAVPVGLGLGERLLVQDFGIAVGRVLVESGVGAGEDDVPNCTVALACRLKNVEGPLDVDLHVLLRREGTAGLKGGAEMQDGVDSGHRLSDVVEGFEVALDDVRADGRELGRLRIIRDGEAEQAVPVPDHAASDVGPDSTGSAGHQDSHARITTSLGAPIRA